MEDAPLEYAQEDPEYQAYIVDVIGIVEALKNKDASRLDELPQVFRDALSTRMNQRLNELENGDINQFELDVEVKKMISVACVGLREKAEGV